MDKWMMIGNPASASASTGDAWNKPDTYYLFPNGSVQTGDKVNAGKLPLNTLVFLKEQK